jgi:acetylornithine deacetylase/succinyl-diaminopimelate desuccinylase-like protein
MPAMKALTSLVLVLGLIGLAQAETPQSAPDLKAREIYAKIISIPSQLGNGKVPEVAEYLAGEFRAAGFPAEDIHILPFKGEGDQTASLVVRYRGKGKAKPILLMAHMDVVAAKREDWQRDPYTLVEENGTFFGRGTYDDKQGVVALTSTFLRLKAEKFVPTRDLIIYFSGDEETAQATAIDTARNHRDLIDAEFALNEGGSVGLKDGKPIRNSVQTSEKVSVSFLLEVKNKGGHSSLPAKDNAIYRLAEGLVRLSNFRFPMNLNETTRAYFERTAQFEGEQTAADIRAALSDKPDPASLSFVRLAANPVYNAQLRTTCVATMLEGGHALNALPQLATAKVNCRVMPGEPVEGVKATLEKVLDDDQIKVTQLEKAVLSAPSALHEEIMGTIGKLSKEFWPTAVILPVMSAGATDGSYLRNAGIPTYGHSGLAGDINDVRAHGKDERVAVKSFYEGQEYLYRLVKMLSGG